MIATAGVDQHLQCLCHFLQGLDLSLKFRDMTLGQPLDLRTLARLVPPQLQKSVDLSDGEAKVACATDETQHMHVCI